MNEKKLTKGEKTKLQIMTAAADLFLKVGLYDITYQQIAQQVGITVAGVYKYFPSMDELIIETCDHWVKSSVSYINQDAENLLSARQYLDQWFERHFIYTSQNRSHDALLFGLYYSSLRSKKMLELYTAIKTRAIKKIDILVQRGNLDGSWNASDTYEIAQSLHSLLAGEIIKLLIEPESENPKEIFLRIQKIYLKLLNAC